MIIRGIALKTISFVVLMIFILPMVPFMVPQIASFDTAKASTPLVNKAASVVYKSSVDSFSGKLTSVTSSGVIGNVFDDNETTFYYPYGDGYTALSNQTANDGGSNWARTVARFVFKDGVDRKVNKIYLNIGQSASNNHQRAKTIVLGYNATGAPSVANPSSGTQAGIPNNMAIKGKLYMATAASGYAKDQFVDDITSDTVFNSISSSSARILDLSQVGDGQRQYYFIPDAPVDAKSIMLFCGPTFNDGSSTGERVPLYEMKLFDVRGENLNLTVGTLPTARVILNALGGTQYVSLPLATVKDADDNLVSTKMSSAVTITATLADGGALPYGVSLDKTVPTSPKLVVAPDASPGTVRITWGYTDSVAAYPNGQTSAVPVTKDIDIIQDQDLLDATNDVNAVTTDTIIGASGNTATFLATDLPTLPTIGATGSIFAWSSNSAFAVVNEDHTVTVTRQTATTDIILTLTGTKNGKTATKDFYFSIPGAPPAPTGFVAVAPTIAGNDGKITGVTNLMEYKLSTASTYLSVTGTQITGLTAGTYDIRLKAVGTVPASFDATVVLAVKPEKTTDIGVWYSTWYAKTAETSTDNKINTWTAWNIRYKPLMPDGTFNTYDSLSEDVIMSHLSYMSDAQIDFIIMDQTNNIDVDGGYINLRSLKVAQTIKKYNDVKSNRTVKYCSAGGGFQWTGNAASIESDAKTLWQRYNATNFGGPDYHYYLDGKPLLVIYAGNRDIGLWNDYTGDKTYAGKFTIRWANNDSVAGYYGWAFNKGTKWHEEAVVVMPGWRNSANSNLSRNYGKTYTTSWNVVLNSTQKPRIIVINSFNEYAERTAVFPADTSKITDYTIDQWRPSSSGAIDNYMYWDMTKSYIQQFKAQEKPMAKPYLYSVFFETFGRGVVDQMSNIVYNSKITAPIEPIYTGYAFQGWYKDANFRYQWNFETDTVSADTTLYAKWTTFDFKGSSLGDPSNVVFPIDGGQHNLQATYQNYSTGAQNTVFIVAIKKNNQLISVYTINKTFAANEEFTFNKTIDIPSSADNANVEVDFYLWDGLSSMKTKHDTVKNSINNVR